MSAIREKLTLLQKNKKKALIAFITAGDPDFSTTEKLILELEKSGVDIIELGVPFSDPMADGPVIQRASERALAKGASLKKILDLVKRVRAKTSIPILLMGYYNPIFSYGLKKYAGDAAKAGVNGTLVVDLPPEESAELDHELKKVDIDLIYLLTPTSDEERIHKVVSRARGFIYFVSMTGITGAKLKSQNEIKQKISLIKKNTSLPVMVGFGIDSPEKAKVMASISDGVVVGSALVTLIEKKKKIQPFINSLRHSLDK